MWPRPKRKHGGEDANPLLDKQQRGLNFLEFEKYIEQLEPSKQYMKHRIEEWYSRQRSEIVNSDMTSEEKTAQLNALEFDRSKQMQGEFEEKAKEQFVLDFIDWMQYTDPDKPNNPDGTPNPAYVRHIEEELGKTDGASVRRAPLQLVGKIEWLSNFIKKRGKIQLELTKLRKGPHMLFQWNLFHAWLFYKYILRREEIPDKGYLDEFDNYFVQNWKEFPDKVNNIPGVKLEEKGIPYVRIFVPKKKEKAPPPAALKPEVVSEEEQLEKEEEDAPKKLDDMDISDSDQDPEEQGEDLGGVLAEIRDLLQRQQPPAPAPPLDTAPLVDALKPVVDAFDQIKSLMEEQKTTEEEKKKRRKIKDERKEQKDTFSKEKRELKSKKRASRLTDDQRKELLGVYEKWRLAEKYKGTKTRKARYDALADAGRKYGVSVTEMKKEFGDKKSDMETESVKEKTVTLTEEEKKAQLKSKKKWTEKLGKYAKNEYLPKKFVDQLSDIANNKDEVAAVAEYAGIKGTIASYQQYKKNVNAIKKSPVSKFLDMNSITRIDTESDNTQDLASNKEPMKLASDAAALVHGIRQMKPTQKLELEKGLSETFGNNMSVDQLKKRYTLAKQNKLDVESKEELGDMMDVDTVVEELKEKKGKEEKEAKKNKKEKKKEKKDEPKMEVEGVPAEKEEKPKKEKKEKKEKDEMDTKPSVVTIDELATIVQEVQKLPQDSQKAVAKTLKQATDIVDPAKALGKNPTAADLISTIDRTVKHSKIVTALKNMTEKKDEQKEDEGKMVVVKEEKPKKATGFDIYEAVSEKRAITDEELKKLFSLPQSMEKWKREDVESILSPSKQQLAQTEFTSRVKKLVSEPPPKEKKKKEEKPPKEVKETVDSYLKKLSPEERSLLEEKLGEKGVYSVKGMSVDDLKAVVTPSESAQLQAALAAKKAKREEEAKAEKKKKKEEKPPKEEKETVETFIEKLDDEDQSKLVRELDERGKDLEDTSVKEMKAILAPPSAASKVQTAIVSRKTKREEEAKATKSEEKKRKMEEKEAMETEKTNKEKQPIVSKAEAFQKAVRDNVPKPQETSYEFHLTELMKNKPEEYRKLTQEMSTEEAVIEFNSMIDFRVNNLVEQVQAMIDDPRRGQFEKDKLRTLKKNMETKKYSHTQLIRSLRRIKKMVANMEQVPPAKRETSVSEPAGAPPSKKMKQ